ncbi:type I-E CRISPR-associated endoribonuclease Cas2 [bacterium]|nr:type I-E CRISPR-associated endoribonuclease Cas2 [bacterium]
MGLSVVVTRDVEDRYRGFLASVMLEVSAGVYISPQLTKGSRERLWAVVTGWHQQLRRGSLTLVWQASDQPGGIGLLQLGEPLRDLLELDDFLLVRKR